MYLFTFVANLHVFTFAHDAVKVVQCVYPLVVPISHYIIFAVRIQNALEFNTAGFLLWCFLGAVASLSIASVWKQRQQHPDYPINLVHIHTGSWQITCWASSPTGETDETRDEKAQYLDTEFRKVCTIAPSEVHQMRVGENGISLIANANEALLQKVDVIPHFSRWTLFFGRSVCPFVDPTAGRLHLDARFIRATGGQALSQRTRQLLVEAPWDNVRSSRGPFPVGSRPVLLVD